MAGVCEDSCHFFCENVVGIGFFCYLCKNIISIVYETYYVGRAYSFGYE